MTGANPSPAYRQWLESILDDLSITVLTESGHFPHLAHPIAVAKLLTSQT